MLLDTSCLSMMVVGRRANRLAAPRRCDELRECLDHIVVFGEQHLRHLLNSYREYYNEARTHLSVSKDAPVPRAIQAHGRACAIPLLGGLHHQYVRICRFRQGQGQVAKKLGDGLITIVRRALSASALAFSCAIG